MNITITHQNNDIIISHKEYNNLLEIIRWNKTPFFANIGRSAWHYFNENPYHFKKSKVSYLHAAKIKGVGVWNPSDNADTNSSQTLPLRPMTEEFKYTSSLPHLGIGHDGFKIVRSESTPFGAILHRRALQEYQNTLLLTRNNVPCLTPFLVVQYPDLSFQAENLGVVVTLSPDLYPHRINLTHMGRNHLTNNSLEFLQKVSLSLGIDGEWQQDTTRLKTIYTLGNKIGSLLRKFSEAGLYRHSGGWDNYLYDTHSGEVLLTDLDSTRLIDEVEPHLQPLQQLRDLTSTIYKLLNRFYHPTSLYDFTLSHIREFDPIYSIVSGYFTEVDSKMIVRASKALWSYFVPHFALMKRHEKNILNDWNSERRKSYKVDMDMFYILSLIALHPIYLSSSLSGRFSSMIDEVVLHKMANDYLEDRYDYLKYLLNY